MLRTNIGRLRIAGFLEGISYLVLLCIWHAAQVHWRHPRADLFCGNGAWHNLYYLLCLGDGRYDEVQMEPDEDLLGFAGFRVAVRHLCG